MHKHRFFLIWFISMVNSAHAFPREDVLVCSLPGGSSFVLRSEYDWSMIPLPLYHHSRESERTGWGIEYIGGKGSRSQVKGWIEYHGKSPEALAHACAHVGAKFGKPLAPFTFQLRNGSWSSLASFPMNDLDVRMPMTGETPSPAQQRLSAAGIVATVHHFGLISQYEGRLIYEKPLYRAVTGTVDSAPFGAVWQSYSDDGGKSWAAPIVSNDAKIFDIGRGWAMQEYRALPQRLNGKLLQ